MDVKHFLKKQLNKLGYDLLKLDKKKKWPTDFEENHQRIISKVQPYTMTSAERLFGLIEAVNYIVQHNIEGSFVECGVWKGGSMLATAEALLNKKVTNRLLYLYDTFEGMPPPGDKDISYDNQDAESMLASNKNKEKNLVWAYSGLEEVKRTMQLAPYPASNINYIKGKVEDTIPSTLPEKIALLRLDTDWYESTRHELIHLYPKLVPGGVLIIDDYGYWKGARKAVDEYIAENNIQILLNRLDDTGRIAIKQ
jgi:O-methyltransferase